MTMTQRSRITLQAGDALYDSTVNGAACITDRAAARGEFSLHWATGQCAGTRETVDIPMLEQAVTNPTGAWERIATVDDGARRTVSLLDAFGQQTSPGVTVSAGDQIQLPPDVETRRRFYAHGWCDPTGELSANGAAILSHYAQLLDHRSTALADYFDRDGVTEFVQHAIRGVDPCLYDDLMRTLADSSVPFVENRVAVKTYHGTPLYIHLGKNEEAEAMTLRRELRNEGFHVEFKEDKRFSDNQNPRRLTVYGRE